MTIETIASEVLKLKKKYGESDPERLCREIGVRIKRAPMGKRTQDCKGFFVCKSRIRIIVLNSDLPAAQQRIILAHELGHAVLHYKLCELRAFHDFELFDETSRCEYEANIFAAEFLMDDESVLDLLNDDISFFNAARMLHDPPELLDFKFRVLKRRGFALNSPINANSNFMKHVGQGPAV